MKKPNNSLSTTASVARRTPHPAICTVILLMAVSGCFLLRNILSTAPLTASPSAEHLRSGTTGREQERGAVAPRTRSNHVDLPADFAMLLQQLSATSSVAPDTRLPEVISRAKDLADKDPNAAFKWALQQGNMARLALKTVLDNWARTDPAAAFEALRCIALDSDPNIRICGLSHLIGLWTKEDPMASWNAVGKLPPSPESSFLKGQVASLWAEKDPGATAAALMAMTRAAGSQDDQVWLQPTFSAVANRLALQSGPQAAQWALGFAEGSLERASAVAGVVSGLFEMDPKSAAQWLEQLEPGTTREAGAVAMAQLAATIDPEISLAWAQRVSDDLQRSLLTTHAAARWLMDDPKKAESWIHNCQTLTEKQKETILANGRVFRIPRDSAQGK